MPPLPFHPAVADWFSSRFGRATEVQQRAWAITARGGHALIAAPTGSGKTLAAFLSAIDALVRDSLAGGLADQVHVLYVSPLKALSNDIRHNLQEPLAGIAERLVAMGLPDAGLRSAVRTGDTPAAERERMRRKPPHILVTTPESLYILLGSDSGRAMLGSVRSIIVDELHAVAASKRGAHLMLSLERLEALCGRAPVRIGLSATVKPLDAMARYLVGERDEPVALIDAGHARERDLALELPRSPLAAVMSNEVWDEVYDRLAGLASEHRTTLVFVNQRRRAERVARHLADRLGEAQVAAHHGSLAREHRWAAEQQLKQGRLKVLVATSSLELGIDIGDVDLVCQLGSPGSINAFLQRVGRAGHAIGAIPKGRLFPLDLDDLVACSALLVAVGRGELDRLQPPLHPLDVLAQQVVAEVAVRDWSMDELHACLRRAQPYRSLTREDFDQVVRMLAEGYATRRGRRGAYLHLDAVNGRVRGRRGARLSALTNAGVIPDQFDSDVVLLPEGHTVGTLNEDFAFESLPGDVFQLGNASYRIVKVETGKVLVEDAHGQPPGMPFWLGEAPSRSDELGQAVSALLEWAETRLAAGPQALEAPLHDELGLPPAAAQQLALYLASARAALGCLPDQRRIVVERFFDPVGDTHVVIHSPHGSRINRAWGLALRKRMCRKFNFELQASALEDSIVLSMGPTHGFALEDLRHYLHSATAREVLVQALLDAPMFGTRWRWNATASLAVRRRHGGRKVPPQFQRSDAEDLLSVVFPDQLACAENIAGEREIPDHPLVRQTLHDCLHEAMDVEGFLRLLRGLESGEVAFVARELSAPSPLAGAILHARPYAFLDGGAAEERRTRTVAGAALPDLETARDIGRLDPQAIEQVRQDAWPVVTRADELHDALLVHGFLAEAEAPFPQWLQELRAQGRIAQLSPAGGEPLWVAAERLHEALAVWPGVQPSPAVAPTSAERPQREQALCEILRGRLELLGPVTGEALGRPMGMGEGALQPALAQLEAEGAVMRGAFTATGAVEWCERRLLARMHRATRDKLRAEYQPVPPAQFMRFLLRWHQVVTSAGDERREGEGGLLDVLRQLEGHAAPAPAWEQDLLPLRVAGYEPALLDRTCATGRVSWWRPAESDASGARGGPVRATPVLLCERHARVHWQQAAGWQGVDEALLSGTARVLLEVLRAHGASFHSDLQRDAHLLGAQVEQGLGELISHGLVSSDSFAGLRALVMPEGRRRQRGRRAAQDPLDDAGRWSLVRRPVAAPAEVAGLAAPHVEHVARALLRRWGVVFRKLLEREDGLPPWRELHTVLRRLEARGEVRGGRFVSGFSGEQFALPDAAAALRRTARTPGRERVVLSAADPLNLAGILTPGEKVPRIAGNRLLLEAGVPIALQIGGEVRYLVEMDAAQQWAIRQQLIRPQALRAGAPDPIAVAGA